MTGIRVVVAGATGRTGSAVARRLDEAEEVELVGAVAPHHAGDRLGRWIGTGSDVVIDGSLQDFLQRQRADVLVDFTLPAVAGANMLAAVEAGVRPVVGTTGIPDEQLRHVIKRAGELGLGAVIVPNFSFGVLLMARFARLAAPLFPQVEIIEEHHQTKIDVPSGTAIHLAESLQAAGARAPVPIHSVRLPGMVAKHSLIFGGDGETLTVTHDSVSRESFAAGVLMAVRAVMRLDHGVTGLEEIL